MATLYKVVIARSVSDEAISLLQKGELKTKTPSLHSRQRQKLRHFIAGKNTAASFIDS